MTTEKQPVTQAMGVTGLRIWSGILAEEYLAAWSGTRKNKIIIEMQDDSVIATMLSALTMPLIAAEFSTMPADIQNQQDVQGAEFLWQCMNDMTQYSWRQHALDMLTMMAWGWSASEIIMKKRLGPDVFPPSQYDDGRLGVDILDPRGQETLERWVMSEDRKGDVDAMVQRDPSTGTIYTIDEWKLIHATYRSRKRSPEGKSPLRELYIPWYMRKNIQIIEMIGAERDLAGLPLIHLPSGATAADMAKAEEIVRNARQDEQGGIVLPAPPSGAEHGWEFELIASKGSKQFRVREIIRDLNKVILMRFFAQFLLVGMESVGTQSLIEGSQDFFTLALESIQQELLETWQHQFVPFLFKFNPFPGMSGLPTIEWSKPGKADVTASIDLIDKMVGKNVLTPGPELEDYVRAAGGLPDRPAGVGEGPRGVPSAPGPFFQYDWEETARGELIGTPKKASSQHPDVALQYSQPDAGDVHIPSAEWKKRRANEADQEYTGFMLAVPVPPGVAESIAVTDGQPADVMHITLTYHPDGEGVEANQVIAAVSAVVARSKPFPVKLSKVGKFEENERVPYIAFAESEGLLAFRTELAAALEGAGFEYSKDYEYKPHVTLKYLEDDPNQELPPFKPQVFVCSGIAIFMADGKRYGLQFGKQYAEVRGTAGRRLPGNLEKKCNRHQSRLVGAYDVWISDIVKRVELAEDDGDPTDEILAMVEDRLDILALSLEEVNRAGLLEAFEVGYGKAPTLSGLQAIEESIGEFNRGVRQRFLPRLLKKIEEALAESEKPALFQLDLASLGNALKADKSGIAGAAGGYWSMTFKGSGEKVKEHDEARAEAGKKPLKVRWILDPNAEHCRPSSGFYGCEELEGTYDSWDDLPTVPAGQVTCRGNCRCGIDVETSPGEFEVAASITPWEPDKPAIGLTPKQAPASIEPLPAEPKPTVIKEPLANKDFIGDTERTRFDFVKAKNQRAALSREFGADINPAIDKVVKEKARLVINVSNDTAAKVVDSGGFIPRGFVSDIPLEISDMGTNWGRVVYGSVQTAPRGAKQYGDVAFRLKSSVARRSTLVRTDSLALSKAEGVLGTNWQEAASRKLTKKFGRAAIDETALAKSLVEDYMEVHIFGGVGLADIESVAVERALAEFIPAVKSMVAKLAEAGVKVELY